MAGQVAAGLPTTPAGPAAPSEGGTLLLVEGRAEDAADLRAALDRAHGRFAIEQVERLEDAIAAVRERRFDAVLVDPCRPPGSSAMDGIERLCAAMPELPIIALTGAEDASAADALKAGAQDFLVKGHFDAHGIERAVLFAIERQRSRVQGRQRAVEWAERKAAEASAKQLAKVNERLVLSALAAQQATEREAAARAQAEAREEELAALFAAMVDPVLVYGEDGRIEDMNRAAEERFGPRARGLTIAEFIERQLIPLGEARPETVAAARLPAARALRGEVVTAERESLDTTKGTCTLSVSSAPLRRSGRVRGAVSVFGDVTREVQAEQALRESEERFRALLAASSDVLYRMSPDWSEMRWLHSARFLAETKEPSTAWVDKYIHPDDQPLLMAHISEAIRARTVFELEHRVRRVDGSLGWTHSRAVPLLAPDGQIVEWFGAASDVKIARSNGFSHLVTKPFATKDLLSVISAVMASGGRPAQASRPI